MSSALDLDAKIAALLQQSKPAPADVEVLLGEVERALADTGQELAQATAQALDPASTSAVVASARNTISDAQFREQRLAAAEERLRAKHQAALERVEAERRAAAHADLAARRDELAGRFPDMWASLAVPLSEFLHEIAACDAEINDVNRLKLGPWLDKVETVARPGVGDIDTHKLVGLHTRIPPWSRDAHTRGEMMWPPQLPRLDMVALVPEPLRQLEAAVAAAAKEAAAARSDLETANRRDPQRRKVLGGSW